MKVSTRLALGFGLVVLLLVTISILAISRMAGMAAVTNDITRDKFPKVLLSQGLMDANASMARSVRSLLLTRDKDVMADQIKFIEEARKTTAQSLQQLDAVIVL